MSRILLFSFARSDLLAYILHHVWRYCSPGNGAMSFSLRTDLRLGEITTSQEKLMLLSDGPCFDDRFLSVLELLRLVLDVVRLQPWCLGG